MEEKNTRELSDLLDNIALELHGLGDTVLFLSQSQMDAGCGESLAFLEWSIRKIEEEVREASRISLCSLS